MKRSQPLIAVCALACAGMATSGSVSAQTAAVSPTADSVATRFELRSPAGCGSSEEFVAKVERRSARIRLLPQAPGARSLIVEIQPPDASGALSGTVTVVELDGATSARKLKAKSCDEAMEGLSLIATVTLDPEALLSDPPAETPPPAPPVAPPPAVKPAPPPERVAPASPGYRLSFGLEASALVNASPEPAWGATASIALELRPGALWSPLLRLSLLHAQRRGLSQGAGDANFAFTVPVLDVCPVRLGPELVAIRPCAYGGVGLVEVWGTETFEKEEYQRASGSAGLALLVQLKLSKTFEIIADGRGGPALLRDRFAFDDVVFFKTHPLLFSAGAGLAGGFP